MSLAKTKQSANVTPNAASALISRERSSIRWSIKGALVASMSSWLMPRSRRFFAAALQLRRRQRFGRRGGFGCGRLALVSRLAFTGVDGEGALDLFLRLRHRIDARQIADRTADGAGDFVG